MNATLTNQDTEENLSDLIGRSSTQSGTGFEVIEETSYVQELEEDDTDDALDMDLVYRTIKDRVVDNGEIEGNFYRIIEDEYSSNTFVGVLGEYLPLLKQTVIKIYKTNPNSEDGVSTVMLTKSEATELMKFLQGNIELAK